MDAACPCRYLGVTVLSNRPAVIMKLYSSGCLAAAIEATGGMGLEVHRALRWGHSNNVFVRIYQVIPHMLCITGTAACRCLAQLLVTMPRDHTGHQPSNRRQSLYSGAACDYHQHAMQD